MPLAVIVAARVKDAGSSATPAPNVTISSTTVAVTTAAAPTRSRTPPIYNQSGPGDFNGAFVGCCTGTGLGPRRAMSGSFSISMATQYPVAA
jgi:hypothetical protein